MAHRTTSRAKRPTSRKPAVKLRPISRKWPTNADIFVVCAHCTSQVGWRRNILTCCVCGGTHQVSLEILYTQLSAWDRPGCNCQACGAIRLAWQLAIKQPLAPVKFFKGKVAA